MVRNYSRLVLEWKMESCVADEENKAHGVGELIRIVLRGVSEREQRQEYKGLRG